MMIKILQGSTVGLFVFIIVLGIIFLLFTPEKIAAYGQFVGIIFPIFIAQVVPALIGTPLTEAVRNITEKKDEVK